MRRKMTAMRNNPHRRNKDLASKSSAKSSKFATQKCNKLDNNTYRTPTGQLIGRERDVIFDRIHLLRDSIHSIQRYLYRRVLSLSFEPVQQVQVSKTDLRRIATWLQPTMWDEPSATEVYCLNSRPFINKQKTLNRVTLLPTPQRACREFFSTSYMKLKREVVFNRRFPVGLLALLSGKSCKQRCASVGCLITPKRGSKDPYSSGYPDSSGVVSMASWRSSDRKRASRSTLEVAGGRLTITANKFSVLQELDPWQKI